MTRQRGVDDAISVDSMRWIDRWVGIPLCVLATMGLKLYWRLWPRSMLPVRNVLFIELSEMGSTILAGPAMLLARERLGAELYFVIFSQNADSLALTNTIPPRNVFTIDCSSLWRLAIDTLAFLAWTRRNGIDAVVDLELFSRFSGLLTGLSGASRRVGFYRFYGEGLYRGDMLTHRVAYNPHMHIAKNFISLIDALTSSTSTVPYSKTKIGDAHLSIALAPPSQAARVNMAMRIGALVPDVDFDALRLVLINPNASQMLPQRRWMPERYAELIRRILAANIDVLILVTGSPAERAEIEKLVKQCGDRRCIAFAGHSTVAELPTLYALAVAMVTNDSGPAHFAAAAGLPTVVLFGPETPKLYGPLGSAITLYAGLACSPCVNASNHRKSACSDNVCMQAISVDTVFQAVSEILDRSLVSIAATPR